MEKLDDHHLQILFPLFLLLLQFFSLLPLSSAYTLPDKYFINCGSRLNFTGSGGRTSVGDQNSVIGGQSSSLTDTSPSADISLLYQSARIFRQPAFYEFKIDSNGTYFVRLHFFAFPSSTILPNATFNVSASGFWLLSNFSVKNSTSLPVIKEFLVTLDVGRFRINFMPSEGSNLAFVNSIEVFLAPENFIPDGAARVTPAGSKNSFDGLLSMGLNTLYRLNVGGLTLTPENDTLWRTWIPDDNFLFNPKAARNSGFFADTPKYQLEGATVYIAPGLVYKTAKELNIDDSRVLNFFNITWSFNVSKNSMHLVRVHFCDIISVSLDVIIFNLYIYNNFGQRISPYDQMSQLAAPFYIDFVVDSDESGVMNISIGPRRDSQNQTAFLNGLEIMELMKKSDSVTLVAEKTRSKKTTLIALVGSIGGAIFILAVAVLLCLRCKKAKPEQSSNWPLSLPMYGRGSSYNRVSEKTADLLPSNLNLALRISYYEIEQSTKNFDPNLLIGEGGFGKVYEGMFRGKKVAVKRSEPGNGQGLLEFQTEIVVLSQIRHRHLVSLIGYCDERSEMILVYEFMEKGTLRDHLYYSTVNLEKSYSAKSELSWKQRLEICIGAAKGLNYLHTGSAGGIIHRDVKSTNILLDEQFVAKVADFGLSKSGLPDIEQSVDVKGTFGYLDPEYFLSLQLTDKSDVYSFGVVLLEILCARPAVVTSNTREEVNLAEWGMLWIKKGQLEKIIDPMLVDKINPNSLRKFSEVTEKCLKPSGSERPVMRDVLWDLEYALQLQLTPMNRNPLEDSTTNASLEFSTPFVQRLPSNSFPAIDEDDASVVFDDASDVTASETFSKLRIAYTLPGNYFINCGSNININVSSVTFVGDLNSGSVSFTTKASSVIDNSQSSSETPSLYQTARIFRQNSSYEFEINSNGTHLVRFHFSNSSNFSEAVFDVSASGFLLLHNFTVKNSRNSTIVKELILSIPIGRFFIYFAPQGSSFAFVNAIEVFPAPPNFIYDTAEQIGQTGNSSSDYKSMLSQALQTIHRINVGGPTLTPENDTLLRTWLPDDDYLFNPDTAKDRVHPGRPDYIDPDVINEYIAPDLVYTTAKEMNIDPNRTTNNFNVTWSYEVTRNAWHLVRVHFCDIVSPSQNTLQFFLYINTNFGQQINPYEQTVQLAAPFFIDFVVNSGDLGRLNISIGPDSNSPTVNAFLNGVEIMEMMGEPGLIPGKNESNQKLVFIIVGSVLGGLVLVCILGGVLFIVLKRRKTKAVETSDWSPLTAYKASTHNNWKTPQLSALSIEATSHASPVPNLNLALKIPFLEIQLATNNFDKKLMIGKGGFGRVYRGNLRDGTKVAVKRSQPGSGQGLPEFQTEIMVLSKIRHRHLVSLIGYCDEMMEMILVYEFMEKVLCARPAINPTLPREQVNLAEWGMLCKNKGLLDQIVDPSIKSQINPNSLRKFAEIADKCLQDDASDRPIMGDVAWDLEYALQLQKTAVVREPHEDSMTNPSVMFEPLPNLQRFPSMTGEFENSMSIIREDTSDSVPSASEVFSQLRINDAR
ncbi:hypothetical protein COLO4_11494 [Corchorus olitorius]|uniref:Protein kinase domain-containing protein n=1 Tax=Corchorus olitorius TaxID=93759 RepID=A0A1R3K494_9ROSI|nr:hypothetical protein COLO4_11494 [Corchorus olitorius]